ncbi:MAG TPA: DNA cytosine methyltransferase [Thermodesulforhabdus norvegica]|uniref:DNA (cytosine-5-)-methyltransferase n=1 Tax=Thermodesulforhabdus norvegica TaxID=39841 RepID=A0A7C1B2A8_9BACT|nr:DNA cytosine methyltransferase [Thermodesulforhabdus norvegica]
MRLRTLDLFHGAGGSSIGAQMAGAEIVAGIDCWQVASDSYRRNFHEVQLVNEDIRKVSTKNFHKAIGDIDLIVASPECTSHSCAKGGRDRCEESKLTAFEVARFAREFRPKWIIIENVIQMKSWSGHSELLEELWKLGYYVREQKLNAQDFGVPQSRKRLFLLCSLSGKVDHIEPQNKKTKTARSIIDINGGHRFTPLNSPKRALATIKRAERAFSKLGENEPFLIVYYGTDGSGGWQSIDRPLRTVTTLDRFAYVKPSPNGHMMRMLQPEELKAAMGFPKNYRLEAGTRRDKIKLMGNAVCPPVMKQLVKSLTETNSDDET